MNLKLAYSIKSTRVKALRKMSIPLTSQQSIPIQKLYKGGIWRCGNRFSMTWVFDDINYSIASNEKKKEMLTSFASEILNTLPIECNAKITINDRRIRTEDFEAETLLKMRGDSLDELRLEHNQMLTDNVELVSGIVQQKYLTISVIKPGITDARAFFASLTNLPVNFRRIGSNADIMPVSERLRVLHDFFRPGEESQFSININKAINGGIDFRNIIAPNSFKFSSNHFKFGDKYGRVLYIRDYPSYLSDKMITILSSSQNNLMLSVDYVPMATDAALKLLERKKLEVETDIARWQNSQNRQGGYIPVSLPTNMTQALDNITTAVQSVMGNNQRVFRTLVTLVHIADSLDELNTETEKFIAEAKKCGCELELLKWQQEQGLNTVLPYGIRKIENMRTMLSNSASALMPFNTRDIQDVGGLYYGVNAISRNLLIVDRWKHLSNANSFIFGISGSGKSFAAKNEILNIALTTDDHIIIVDPEAEYSPLITRLGGEAITIASGSSHRINALDMNKDYGDSAGENPIALKSEFMMSLCEQLMRGKIEAHHFSIIDRCTINIYSQYMKTFSGDPPTLLDFRRELERHPEREAEDIALAMELFTDGTLNVFASQTNINTDNRIIAYDMHRMSNHLRPVGMLVMLEAIQNRVIQNRQRGIRTWIYIDEIYIYFMYKYSGEFLHKCWKRFRKQNACLTGITQNVEEVLLSDTARTMLGNTDFLLLLNQAATDRAMLKNVLKIDESQLYYVTDAKPGSGLLKLGKSLVPFINDYPKNNTYKLLTTKPSDFD